MGRLRTEEMAAVEKNPDPKYIGDVGFMPQNPAENIRAAQMKKTEGSDWLKQGNVVNAQKCYKAMLSNLKHLDKDGGGASANPMAAMGGGAQKDDATKTTPEQDIEVLALTVAMYNNRAVCHKKEAEAAEALAKTAASELAEAKEAGVEAAAEEELVQKLEKVKKTAVRRWNDVVKTTSEVIKKEEANGKARYRRAWAYAMVKDVDHAREDLVHCTEKEAKGLEARLAKLDEQNDKKQARVMRRMLGGGADEEAAAAEEAAPAEEGAAAEEEEGVRGSSTHVDLKNLKDSGTGELSAEEFAALRAKTKSAAECAKNMTPEQQAAYGCKTGVAASAVREDSDDSDDDGADFGNMGGEGAGALLGDY